MDLLHCLALLRQIGTRRSTLDADASDVARRGRKAVLGRIGDEARLMGPSELLGYVRARAALVIHREVGRLLVGRRDVSDRARRQLVDMAMRQVVDMVVAELAESWAWRRGYRAAA